MRILLVLFTVVFVFGCGRECLDHGIPDSSVIDGFDGGAGGDLDCLISRMEADIICTPRPIGEGISAQIIVQNRCAQCGTVFDHCEVKLDSNQIFLETFERKCPSEGDGDCNYPCQRITGVCDIPPLVGGSYIVYANGEFTDIIKVDRGAHGLNNICAVTGGGMTSCRLHAADTIYPCYHDTIPENQAYNMEVRLETPCEAEVLDSFDHCEVSVDGNVINVRVIENACAPQEYMSVPACDPRRYDCTDEYSVQCTFPPLNPGKYNLVFEKEVGVFETTISVSGTVLGSFYCFVESTPMPEWCTKEPMAYDEICVTSPISIGDSANFIVRGFCVESQQDWESCYVWVSGDSIHVTPEGYRNCWEPYVCPGGICQEYEGICSTPVLDSGRYFIENSWGENIVIIVDDSGTPGKETCYRMQ